MAKNDQNGHDAAATSSAKMGSRVTIQQVVTACFNRGLLNKKQARYAIERAPMQEAKLSNKMTPVEAKDPLTQLIAMALEPPDRAGRPIEPEEVIDAVAELLGVETIHIDPLKLDSGDIVRALPRAFALSHAILVLNPKDELVTVAAANPLDVVAVDTVRNRLAKPIEVKIALASEIVRLIREIYGFKTSVAAAEKDLSQLPDIQNLEQFFSMRSGAELDASDSHIVKAVDHLLGYALDQRASDIHIEPKSEIAKVRLRIDGVLHTVHTFSRGVHSAIVSRLKTLARMDISEKRMPQDGRIKTEYDGKRVELRVSTLPVAFGEKIVMRIFDPLLLEKDLPDLGLVGNDLTLIEKFMERPHGIFLVTGPTGSGKTTTLYAALKRLATEARNVSTVEDPIENIRPELNQVGVQPLVGLTFASALRTLLRQDPDVIMIGEIRDSETAKMAIQAALTGHLVLSTLHTNDAPGAVGRMLDMGVEPFLLASTLLGSMAQRLVRTPCPYCAIQTRINPYEAKALGLDPETLITEGEGCHRCRRTGYIGRTGIFEILPVTKEVSEAIHKARPSNIIADLGKSAGMLTLQESGAIKVKAGITTPREVLQHSIVASNGGSQDV